MQGENIRSCSEPAEVAVELDCLEIQGRRVSAVAQCAGIEDGCPGSIQGGDPDTIEVGDKAVVVLNIEGETENIVGAYEIKRYSDID